MLAVGFYERGDGSEYVSGKTLVFGNRRHRKRAQRSGSESHWLNQVLRRIGCSRLRRGMSSVERQDQRLRAKHSLLEIHFNLGTAEVYTNRTPLVNLRKNCLEVDRSQVL